MVATGYLTAKIPPHCTPFSLVGQEAGGPASALKVTADAYLTLEPNSFQASMWRGWRGGTPKKMWHQQLMTFLCGAP